MKFWTIRQAASRVLAGDIIAYPTEAVYGLGCNPYDGQAVIRLLQIKQRSLRQGVILIGSAFEQFGDFIRPLDQASHEKIMARWPGPVTWLLPASQDCPRWLCGEHDTVAVRVTAHALSRRLCHACDLPLVSTSANKHGRPAARSALQVRLRLGREIDLIIPGPVSGDSNPSEIRDVRTDVRLR